MAMIGKLECLQRRGASISLPVVLNADPLAAIPFTLRLQTHLPNGSVPVGLYQDTACTIPATQDGDPVAAWRDEFTLGNPKLIQPNIASQPMLFFDGGVPTILFDGVDDFFAVPDMSSMTAAEMLLTLKNGNPMSSNCTYGLAGVSDNTQSYIPYFNGDVYDAFFSSARKSAIYNIYWTDWFSYGPLSQSGLWQSRADGVLLYSTASNTVSAPTAGTIGKQDGGVWLGQITSMYLFPPSDASRSLILSYAQSLTP